jgi:Lrp/AsnC family transcriptional regulator, leucine-responsive regulatory protein
MCLPFKKIALCKACLQKKWQLLVRSSLGYLEFVFMTAEHNLDKLDRSILRRLQENGRETYDVIGEQVGLSPSAVLRRVKRLEEAGVIERYVALVPPEKVGLGLTAYLNVRLEKSTETHKRNPMDAFKQSVQNWPEVVECASLTGEMDYLLRVVVADMQHYSRFIMETLLKHPSVSDCKTSFVLDRVKATTSVPL